MLNSNLIIPTNQEELAIRWLKIYNSLDIKDVKIEELHNLTMILDERWYDPYKQWLEITTLHNTPIIVFGSIGLTFPAKSDKFDFNEPFKTMWNHVVSLV